MAVVVTGGYGHDTCEIYDIAANKWMMINKLPEQRSFHSSTTVAGIVYVAGGQDQKVKHLNSLYRYYPHPKKPSWIKCASLNKARYSLGLATEGKKIFAIGGYSDQGCRSIIEDRSDRLMEVYDPGANMWTAGPALPSPISGVATASLNGLVYAVSEAVACCYNPSTTEWNTIEPPNFKTRNLALAATTESLFAIGGYNMETKQATSRVERYDPEKNSWVDVAPLPEELHSVAVAVVGSDIYCCGGTTNHQQATSAVHVFSTESNSWTVASSMHKARGAAAAAGLNINSLLRN